MRVALQWSICRDDALDAYQRALEIYVRRIDTVDPATEISWLRVVVKHEAIAVRRVRAESVGAEEPDLDAHAADAQRPVDDLLAGRERVERSAEALRRLKPDEATALMLKAQGLSYREIGDRLGWSYTKTNRCITEGRARFLRTYAEIEAGAECERIAPTLAALVGGTATAGALLELRPHLQHCATCRATVRKLHAGRLGRLAALWPLPALLAPLRWASGRIGGHPAPTAVVPDLGPGGVTLSPEDTHVPELSPVQDIVDLDEAIRRIELPNPAEIVHHERLFDLQAHLYGWWHRLQGSDVATSAQLAAGSSGGGRIATIGAIVGLCLSSVGAGTVCVVSGVVDNPFTPPRKEHASTDRTPKPRQPAPARSTPTPIAIATPVPTPVSNPKPKPATSKERRHEASNSKPSQTQTPTSHEQPTPAAAPAAATQDFTFEQAAPAAPPPPAPAPATGGGEFAP